MDEPELLDMMQNIGRNHYEEDYADQWDDDDGADECF